MFAPVSDAERQRLREAAPEVLAVLYGVTDLRRPFRCPDLMIITDMRFTASRAEAIGTRLISSGCTMA